MRKFNSVEDEIVEKGRCKTGLGVGFGIGTVTRVGHIVECGKKEGKQSARAVKPHLLSLLTTGPRSRLRRRLHFMVCSLSFLQRYILCGAHNAIEYLLRAGRRGF